MNRGKLTELRGFLGDKKIDVLVCSASFESRCLSIANSLDPTKVESVMIALDKNFQSSSDRNLKQLTSRFESKHQIVDLDINDPIFTADSLINTFKGVDLEHKRVVIDITAFTRESLMMLIRYLSESIGSFESIEYIYANASDYSVGDEGAEKWLSKGIKEIRSVLGFPGAMLPTQKNHLIVLVGFEFERTLMLVRECEPTRISLGRPDKTDVATKPHQNANFQHFARLKSILGEVNEFEFASYDPSKTKLVIKQQIECAPDFNTIVACMNTKISAIGALSAAFEDDSVQVCYAQANKYNTEKYSEPGEHFFHFHFPAFRKTK